MTAFWDKFKKEEDEKGKKKDAKKSPATSGSKKDDSKKKAGVKPAPKIDPAKSKKVKSEKDTKKKKKAKKVREVPREKAGLIKRVLIGPMMSEDVMNKQALGKYVFKVTLSANKSEVKKAVEAMYGVSVEKVNMVRYSPQNKLFRGMRGKKKAYKKAIVSVQKGQEIDVF